MDRRAFFTFSAGVLAARIARASTAGDLDLSAIERRRVLIAADRYLREQPITITAASSPRSAGGRHDYFSEGDYWWPDPVHPDGPYVQRDGMTNPENFTAHRHFLLRLSLQVPALAAAWLLTRERRYAEHAVRHLRAWFVDSDTLMNPHLLYAQAIRGRVTGRGTGIIDTIHLVEVARALDALDDSRVMADAEREAVRDWFRRYLAWMTTHEYGIAERDAKNNHGTCWVMQVAAFARSTQDPGLAAFCRDRFRRVLVPNQIAADGSFPEELRRTKPYGYSLFNLDAMAVTCQILSTPSENLWAFQLPDGRGFRQAMAYMAPFIADKRRWPRAPDVMYFDRWPVRHPSLLFAGLAFGEPSYLALWRTLDPDPTVEEIVRNFFVRQPLLWLRSGQRV